MFPVTLLFLLVSALPRRLTGSVQPGAYFHTGIQNGADIRMDVDLYQHRGNGSNTNARAQSALTLPPWLQRNPMKSFSSASMASISLWTSTFRNMLHPSLPRLLFCGGMEVDCCREPEKRPRLTSSVHLYLTTSVSSLPTIA